MFVYTPEIIDKLRKSLSNERIARYESVVGGDRESALRLYTWNAQISAAFYVPLQGLEITLRNALHRQLVQKFNRDDWWHVRTTFINPRFSSEVEKAEEACRRNHGSIDIPHMVAELSFGFWLSLLNKSYHPTLWVPALHKAFPNVQANRPNIHAELDHLRIFRNRIAHHEPIFHRDLKEDYNTTIKVTGWICLATSQWINQHNTVHSVLQKCP